MSDEPIKSPPPNIPTRNPSPTPIYVNEMQLRNSFNEFFMDISECHLGFDKSIERTSVARLVMTPAHAKSMMLVLRGVTLVDVGEDWSHFERVSSPESGAELLRFVTKGEARSSRDVHRRLRRCQEQGDRLRGSVDRRDARSQHPSARAKWESFSEFRCSTTSLSPSRVDTTATRRSVPGSIR